MFARLRYVVKLVIIISVDLPPLPSPSLHLETFLQSPEALPIHDFRHNQRLWPRETSPASLFNTSLSDGHTIITVERDSSSGKLLGYHEVEPNGIGLTSKNSTSLQRAPGPPSLSVKGDPTNFPFWPGGMEHIEMMKDIDKDLSKSDVDFETNLLTVPPGFSEGVSSIHISADGSSNEPQDPIGVSELLFSDDNALLTWADDTSTKKPAAQIEEAEKPIKEDQTKTSLQDGSVSELLDDILPTKEVDGVPQANVSYKHKSTDSKWAVKVNVNDPVDDFHERIPNMAHNWEFTLDNFQKRAILHLENHDNVFVAAHTSAGKTVVAEYAIALSKKHLTRAIYTSPIKALSNQKFRDFRLTFGTEEIGLLTGDVQINTTAPCLIMTTEILRSMLYNGSDVIRDVEWVIFDEVHYVNDSERGVVWEEVLIMLPEHVSIIMLSATVPNALDFADWVGRTKRKEVYVVSTLKRPVPLKHYLYTGNSKQTSDQLFEIVGENKKFNTRGYQLALEAKKQRVSKAAATTGPKFKQFANPKQDKNIWLSLVHMLEKKSQLPVVAFTFSRNRCNGNADSLSSLDLTTSSEKSEIHVFFQKSISILKGCDRKLPQVIWTRDLLKRGIAVHHSGILPIIKEVIELLFQRGLVKLLFATETFAMGVNMPARTVVFDSTRKHDGVKMRDLHTGEYVQMAGRAGRRGLDLTGTVILMCKADVPEASELSKMILGQPTTLESKFRLTYSMLLNLMRVETLRVEDMMKRSFAESDTTRHEVDRKQALDSLQSDILSLQLDEPCPVCSTDIDQYYSDCSRLTTLDRRIKTDLLSSPHTLKALSAGRVVIVNSTIYGYSLGVILQQNSTTKVEKTFSVLVLCDSDIGDEEATCVLFPPEEQDVVQPYKPLVQLFRPDGVVSHTVVELTGHAFINISNIVMKVESKVIIEDFKRRKIPRFREYPHSSAAVKVRQDLLRLVEDNPQGITCLDPMKDLKVNTMEYMELKDEKYRLEKTMCYYDCVRCPDFDDHFIPARHKSDLQDKLSKLKFMLSESSLLLLPEYTQRLQVLKYRGYVSDRGTVQLKGRVTCELHSHEVLLTELLFDNVFMDYSPAEIAALLSCIVFQQAKCSEPNLTEHLLKGKSQILNVAKQIAETERWFGIDTSVEDYQKNLKFGLVEVVFEWANGKEFLHITQLTDVLEGMIVRCIQRLDETCKDVRNAARVIGDPVLFEKMQEASRLIKRDIVFAASLYTI